MEDPRDRLREQGEREPASDDRDIGAPDESPSADQLPPLPADDGTPLGDTDQHSDA